MKVYNISEHFEFDEPLPTDRKYWYALCFDKKGFWDEDFDNLMKRLTEKGYSKKRLEYIIGSHFPGPFILPAFSLN